ncbi:hypothetical protein [Ammoniphilus sp. YIM 78166]|uniref:hypothetical protein n=1 Tax=Ammoniphilus sp. YIM 78166 TaxID=1644106 RepID=UPI001F0E1774|nr:hypothetical protein [Ammoniphilus sp. YIM 78166]
MITKDDVLALVEKEKVEFIRIEFLDYAGVTRGRTVRPKQLKDAMEKGINFSTAIMSFDMFDEYIPNPTFDQTMGISLLYRIQPPLPFYLIEKIRLECFVT